MKPPKKKADKGKGRKDKKSKKKAYAPPELKALLIPGIGAEGADRILGPIATSSS